MLRRLAQLFLPVVECGRGKALVGTKVLYVQARLLILLEEPLKC